MITDIAASVFVPIDVQRLYADPEYKSVSRFVTCYDPTDHTDSVAKSIASVAPQFNDMGMDICWVYYDSLDYPAGFDKADGGPHYVCPSAKDAFAAKSTTSAFETEKSPLHSYLLENEKNHLIVAGMYLTACVYETTMDALIRGYKVTILTDLVSDGRYKGTPIPELANPMAEFKFMAQQRLLFSGFPENAKRLTFARSTDLLNSQRLALTA